MEKSKELFVVSDIRAALGKKDTLKVGLIILTLVGIECISGYFTGEPANGDTFKQFVASKYFPGDYHGIASDLYRLRDGLFHDYTIKKNKFRFWGYLDPIGISFLGSGLKPAKLGGMAKDRRAQKNVFKQIFMDGWEAFKQTYPRYESADEVVQKMLGCGDRKNGYSLYICPDCHEQPIVAFSCKSTFCLSCANVYGQDWAETVKGMLHPGVSYRHLILTVPEGL